MANGYGEASFMYKEGSAILMPYAHGMDESKKAKRNLFAALFRTYISFFLMAALLKFVQDVLTFVSPQLLR